MNKTLNGLATLIIVMMISCAPQVHKTFGFDKIEDLQGLSGTYSGTSTKSQRHLAEFNILESFFIENESTEKFTLTFPNDRTVVLGYQVVEDGQTIDKKLELKGKKTRTEFYIDLEYNRTLVPFVFDKSKLTKISIGKNPKGQLIVRSYHGESTGVLSFRSSSFYVDVRVFEKL